MREVARDYDRLARRGEVGRAVITTVWGSAPRPPGATLLATADGVLAGSVSGGCVESEAAAAIAETITRKEPRLVSYGVSNARAWEVGLACGGTIELLVQPAVPPAVLEAARAPSGQVFATPLEGEAMGRTTPVDPDGGAALETAAAEALRHESAGTVSLPGGRVFLEVFPPQPRLVIFGAGHIAMELVPLAAALGFRTIVADGREAFLTADRFPGADELIRGWPAEAFERVGLDASTYVCVLSHDPKFDEPALAIALPSPARYVGAIGSRKTQAERRQRLAGQGVPADALERLRGPIGLDLGGRRPVETALAILSEMVAVRYGASGQPLAREARGHE